jgi:acetyl-CoA synthetase
MLPPGDEPNTAPTADWTPTPDFIATTNVGWLMQQTGKATYAELHTWSVRHRAEYWRLAIERLDVRFQRPFREIVDLSCGVEAPEWLPGARLNIVESCFSAPGNATAILHQTEGSEVAKMTFGELRALTGRVAANLRRLGYKPGDALAILMPMTAESVAIYLGIVAAGCVVVGVADSFAPREIATRLRIAGAVGVFTQDVQIRGGKAHPLYANAIEAKAPCCIVVPAEENLTMPLREGDFAWQGFLEIDAPLEFEPRDPSDATNILFSSGTTGDPKAIPWTQTTPLKCAADAHFHVNIQPGDVLVWPTNLGWMMGPWVIFGSLLNRAAMGLYCGAPTGRAFGQFVQASGATVLGLVPSLVRVWRTNGCMDGLDWSAIKAFSSTGECSRADDMRWLMQFAGGKPVIEYCGGTEIGGAYITSTLARPNVAGTFNTPTLGLDVVILDEEEQPADIGELFIVPPSIGLSNTLLNKDHHETYFAGTPRGAEGEVLRRHGDQMERLQGGYWRAHGRADDTMNLGGIKVSSAEIEQTLRTVPGVTETAAIAVSCDGGPSQLIIYAVCSGAPDRQQLAAAMQSAIKRELNPLFKIHDVIAIDALPRTASNKVMRRELRARYSASHPHE